jgi:phage terminase large subunit-like protein
MTIENLPYFGVRNQILTYSQLQTIYKITDEIFENLDEFALNELFSGNENDLENILEIIIEETANSLYTTKGPIKNFSFGYLDKFATSLDESLKKLVFNYFILTCLPDFEINWHHLEWGNLTQLYKYLCIIAARDHSKSFMFSKAYPLWKLYRYTKGGVFKNANRDLVTSKKGMLVTAEFTLGKDFLAMIKEEIEENAILRERLYPQKSAGEWGMSEIKCRNGAELQIKSIESRLRGRHPHWMVVDDILDESALYSSEMREKFRSFFHSVLMNAIVPGGQVLLIGTPFHEKDLYADLKTKKAWKVFEYPAIFPDGALLWENRYNFKALIEKRESQGSIIFSREILCKPISSESTIFPYHILERSFIGMSEYTLVKNYYSHLKKFNKISVGCDFAISSEIGADYTVYTVWGLDDFGYYWLLYMWREKGASYNKQISVLKEINSNFQPNVIMAEDNVFQKVMVQIAKEAGLPIIGHTTGTNKFDLRNGLPGLAVLFEQNKIKLPRGDQFSKDMTDILTSELSSITWKESGKLESISEHDDTGMSSWLGIKGLNYVNESFSYDFI